MEAIVPSSPCLSSVVKTNVSGGHSWKTFSCHLVQNKVRFSTSSPRMVLGCAFSSKNGSSMFFVLVLVGCLLSIFNMITENGSLTISKSSKSASPYNSHQPLMPTDLLLMSSPDGPAMWRFTQSPISTENYSTLLDPNEIRQTCCLFEHS